ncbi:MAG: MBL fold metallo-hydrolase [Clostridia bacterium]|nr:MBL fold metallo-hydrolase [Clostridia bacterium]
MKIEWLGHSSFKLTESTGVSVVTDPYDQDKVGIKFPKVSADVVTISHNHFDHNCLSALENYNVVVDTVGVNEIDGVEISGFRSYHDEKKGALRGKNIVYRIRMDGVETCHLGDIGEELSPMLAELIGSINILLIPVGGRFTINAEQAKEYVDLLMPDVVIPMHYMMEGYNTEFDELDEFLDLFPKKSIEYVEENEIQFDRTDFDGEKTRILVLKKID